MTSVLPWTSSHRWALSQNRDVICSSAMVIWLARMHSARLISMPCSLTTRSTQSFVPEADMAPCASCLCSTTQPLPPIPKCYWATATSRLSSARLTVTLASSHFTAPSRPSNTRLTLISLSRTPCFYINGASRSVPRLPSRLDPAGLSAKIGYKPLWLEAPRAI